MMEEGPAGGAGPLLETETSRDAVTPEGDRTAVKTEEESTWRGDVMKCERQDDLVQQGKLETGNGETQYLKQETKNICFHS